MSISKWEPADFKLEQNTVWSFPERGDWATHDAKYRGNWSPYIPRNILLRYSHKGDWILDQFAGGGTTLVEAKLLGRNSVGIDVNDIAISRCVAKCDFERDNCGKVEIRQGDATNLSFLKCDSIDLICTHPPYANIIKYSENIENDISRCNVTGFLEQMKSVASECYRVLKCGKYCAILMGDTRQKGLVVPMSFEVMKRFEAVGFKTKEIIIKQQHNCKMSPYWEAQSKERNFLLLAHEYLFIFQKRR